MKTEIKFQTIGTRAVVSKKITPEQLTRAASSMEAALARLDIEPGITTEAELADDDAEILPALVDGQPVITPEPNSGMSEGREN
jgi:hypothetical protein